MSTIVYRDGIMAADTRAWAGRSSPIGQKAKIRRLSNGFLLGCASGVPGAGEYLMDWYEDGHDHEKLILPKDFTLLIVNTNGQAFLADDSPHLSGPITAPWFAIGSGCDYAMGAMAMGATAVQAVEVACHLDSVSDLPVQTITHRN